MDQPVKKQARPVVTTEPYIDQRPAQPYMGIRSQVPIRRMKNVIQKSLGEIFSWLDKKKVEPAGAPFIRYHVINMEGLMDLELGVPVAAALPAEGQIHPGELPAGRYGALVYTGVRNGIKGNAALLDWAIKQGLAWDRWDVEAGDAFCCRYEMFITDPDDEPDQDKWETEVAILLKEDV